MFRFLLKRVLSGVLTLIAISVLTFGLFFAGPADPAQTMCGSKICSPELHARIEESLGLDQPIIKQYSDYMKGIFVGRVVGGGDLRIDCPAPCLGVSFRTKEPVLDIVKQTLPVTASIVLGAAVVYLTLGVGLGMVSAARRGTLFDRISVGTSLFFGSMQLFFLGPVLMLIFVWNLKLLPRPTYVSPFEDPGNWFMGLLLPWITLGLYNSAIYARLSRAQMLETLSEDFVRTARAKGLPMRRVYFKHAFRAAVTPIVTIAGIDLGIQLGGVVITETTFSLSGLGREAATAAVNNNLPIIMGAVLIAAVFIVIMNVLVDSLYAVIDPRVRLG